MSTHSAASSPAATAQQFYSLAGELLHLPRVSDVTREGESVPCLVGATLRIDRSDGTAKSNLYADGRLVGRFLGGVKVDADGLRLMVAGDGLPGDLLVRPSVIGAGSTSATRAGGP